jgi:hypothetical protein
MLPVNVLQCLIMLSSYLPYYEKMKEAYAISMPSVYPSYQPLNTWTNIYVTLYVYHGTWTPPNGVLHKSLRSVCVCIAPSSFLGNSSINAFPRHQNVVGCVGFYVFRAVSKEPLVIIMLSLYHFVITCAVSWPYSGSVFISNFPPTSVLPCSSREQHICSLAQGSVLWHCRKSLHTSFDLNYTGLKNAIKHGSLLLFS